MKKMFKIIMTVMLALLPLTSMAQRIQQPLGRGVVVAQNGSNAMVTWRRLAQEPENTRYNVYVNGHQVNSSPLTNTNWRTTSATVPTGAKVTVTTVDAAGHESAQSVPFVVKSFDMRNMFVDILFPDFPLSPSDYTTSFVWPADLDGDGEMDYVVDRKSTVGISTRSHKVQAYHRDGTLLWTIDMGPNVAIDQGQDDMVLAYDIDCDGRAEVIVKSSDGTRFWDATHNTWGTYVYGKTTGDTDGDGIIDYSTQNRRNPPFYVSIVDGMTGAERITAELDYAQVRDGVDQYGRDNRQDYKGDNDWLEYASLCGQFAICYFDGIHPSLGIEVKDRLERDGSHHYYLFEFAFDWTNGTASNWHHKSTFSAYGRNPSASQFHMVRVCDVDGDGIDELIPGGYGWSPKGGMVMSANIAHGDRFRLSDIDPERPGLECFAIQQYAGDMLGQILYDAGTGEAIKKWYLAEVGDVGRGECMDIDSNHLGWEMWSTMGGVYDAQGNLIPELESRYPCEGIWWDGDLDRENVGTSDSHYNVYVEDMKTGRLIQIARESKWRYTTVYAKRAAFWGDIIGDWREELILLHKENNVNVGIVGFTTDYATDIDNIYCLQEDPHYRGDCSTKGYYQSPNPGFYLGFDMPRPQLPPCMVTDLIYAPTATQWTSAGFTNYERSASAAYEDGKSVLFDLNSSATCTLSSEVRPSMIYAMPVKGQTVTLSGEGSIGGNGQLWKSQQGRFVVHVPLNHTGGTYISEGILEAGEIKGDVELRARGTLAGNAVVKGNLVLEGALNYEGCRLMPGVGDGNVGTIKLCKGLTVNRRLFVEADIHAAEGQTDCVVVEQGFNITEQGQLVFTIVPDQSKLSAERYMLLQYDTSDGLDLSKVSIRGLQGLSYKIVDEENALWLIVNEQREASDGVRWTGAETSLWDYQTENFELSGVATEFVANDNVAVGDDALSSTVQLNELYPVSGITFDNESKAITVQGLGGFSGRGGLLKTGKGRLLLKTVNNDYTGATIIEGGTVTVSELADGGLPSSLGAASSAATNWQIGKATLIIDNANTATNRALTLTDTATIQVNNGVTALKGQVVGSKGTLVKAGSGQLNITYAGNNTWKSTILQGGTLAMGVWNTTFGNATSPIAVTGNSTITIFNNNTTSAIPSLRNTITVNRQRTLTINGGQRCNVQGAWLGQGTVKINFPYVRGDFSTNLSQFEGTLNPTSGQFRMVADIDLSKGTFQPEAGVYAVGVKAGSSDEVSRTHKIGSLVSTAADAQLGTSVWNVGYLDKSTTFAGIIGSRATLNKYGDGDLTLTGSSAGAINIYAGSITANNDSVATTTATITVNSGGMLCGTGKVATVNILRGGIVGAGKATGTIVDTLTLTAPLTVSDGGIIRLRARGNASQIDKFGGEGNVVLTNPVFRIERVSGSWSVDREYKVFTGSGSITLNGTPTFEPAVPMEGYRWDYSQLASDGILRIEADPTGIEVMNNEQLTMNNSPIYDLSGRRIERATKDEMQSTIRHPGIYIIKGRKYLVK